MNNNLYSLTINNHHHHLLISFTVALWIAFIHFEMEINWFVVSHHFDVMTRISEEFHIHKQWLILRKKRCKHSRYIRHPNILDLKLCLKKIEIKNKLHRQQLSVFHIPLSSLVKLTMSWPYIRLLLDRSLFRSHTS